MKKVLLIGKDESNTFLLQRLADEGCEVKLLVPRETSFSTHLPRATSGQDALEWEPDYVICCSSGFGPYLKRFRERGSLVIGGGPITDQFDTDVTTALRYLDAAGVPTPDYQVFDDVATAVDFVIDSRKPWRYIPGNRESTGYKDGMALATALEKLHESDNLPPQFALHLDFPGIHRGELSLWSSFHVTGFIHEKGLMNPCFAMSIAQSDYGIPTREGVTMFPIPTSHPIIKLTLGRLAEGLGKINYCGPVTLGCLVQPGEFDADDETPYHWEDRICVHNLSLTPPDGFWAAFTAGLEMPMHFFLERLLEPARPNNPFDFWAGVVSARKLTIPPYPLTEAMWLTEEQKRNLTQLMPAVDLPYKPSIFWNGVCHRGDGSLKCAHPVLGYLTGKAARADQSLQQIEDEFNHLSIPTAQVHLSLGFSFEVDMLPTGLAESQLRWEQEVEKEASKKPERKAVKVVASA